MSLPRELMERLSIEPYLSMFYDVQVECPYGLEKTAVYRQQQFASLPDSLLGKFFDAGFRRNGNSLYTMVCPNCDGCLPIRLAPEEFAPSRSQKRTLRRNQDVQVLLGPLRITDEKLSLCGFFLDTRYPGRGNSAVGYYGSFFANSICTTLEIEYRHQGRLIGVAIVDLGSDWLNAVYFYFDPAEEQRSPGIFNILYLVDFCRRQKIHHLYLGYLIREVRAMRYKQHFKPHYLREHGVWQRHERQ